MENKRNPIQVMREEHEIIGSAEQTVQLLDRYWKKNEEDFVKQVHSLLRFFREYSDRYHHYKEEQVLFPEMENLNDFALNSLISELKEHHEMFREYTRTIEEHLHTKQSEKAYLILTTYMDELLDHIAAENEELFVMAESLFSETALETMYFRFRDIDMELGAQEKDRLSSLLQGIEAGIAQN